tara:strand:+ start:307 stop:501 length:195 start_codon:yes stop_codon:yes gene_type:complete
MISYTTATIIIVLTNFFVILMSYYYLGRKLNEIGFNVERRNEGEARNRRLLRHDDIKEEIEEIV